MSNQIKSAEIENIRLSGVLIEDGRRVQIPAEALVDLIADEVASVLDTRFGQCATKAELADVGRKVTATTPGARRSLSDELKAINKNDLLGFFQMVKGAVDEVFGTTPKPAAGPLKNDAFADMPQARQAAKDNCASGGQPNPATEGDGPKIIAAAAESFKLLRGWVDAQIARDKAAGDPEMVREARQFALSMLTDVDAHLQAMCEKLRTSFAS